MELSMPVVVLAGNKTMDREKARSPRELYVLLVAVRRGLSLLQTPGIPWQVGHDA